MKITKVGMTHTYNPETGLCVCGSKVRTTHFFSEEEKWYGASEGVVCERSGEIIEEPRQ